ncbi:MAG: hypothetical protein JOZ69_19115 [Myxococcales bacterium]|nr:hypothetical protein [Myxococcales bacterium]
MNEDVKRKVIKTALLTAIAGISLAEVTDASAQQLVAAASDLTGTTPILVPNAFGESGPSWVEFIRHNDGGAISNPIVNPGLVGGVLVSGG